MGVDNVALGEIWVERVGGKKESEWSNLRAEDLGLKGWVGRRKVDLVGTEEAIMRIEGQDVL